ncbi:MAG: hypothetical protein I3273_04300 [Candidatus Moeniiplasma glomeromycotorum]|nr:hypothetical protein [Candidatus Moeniiplasma glomeromycotorum]MCE8169317.1 hypothetical protein [Candidatus Moeniiplasma glomeromycotorum]
MPPPLKLIKEEFSKIDDEWQWTYLLAVDFILNSRQISYITVTDHTWRKKGRELITHEIIINILIDNFHQQRIRAKKRCNNRDVFVEEFVPYGDNDYILIFWFIRIILLTICGLEIVIRFPKII